MCKHEKSSKIFVMTILVQ